MVSRLLAVLVGGALLGALAAPALAGAVPATSPSASRARRRRSCRARRCAPTATAINKDGQAGHTCSGTGAAGALEKATGGDWAGPGSTASATAVQTIKGETHAFPAPEYFALWINHRSATEGVCGTTTELQQGDEVLFFVDRCIIDPPRSACARTRRCCRSG